MNKETENNEKPTPEGPETKPTSHEIVLAGLAAIEKMTKADWKKAGEETMRREALPCYMIWPVD